MLVFPRHWNGNEIFVSLSEELYGKTIFSYWTSRGAIGCTLSHLSVIHDAYESHFETIWVLEDDLYVFENPHRLSDYIAELDALTGAGNWDILFTDFDYLREYDTSKSVQKQFPMKWRPDMPAFDVNAQVVHQPLGNHFLKIAS